MTLLLLPAATPSCTVVAASTPDEAALAASELNSMQLLEARSMPAPLRRFLAPPGVGGNPAAAAAAAAGPAVADAPKLADSMPVLLVAPYDEDSM
jgi:hypothetical protein